MRFKHFLVFLMLWPAAAGARPAVVSPREFWSRGDQSVWSGPCGAEVPDRDEACTSLRVRQGKTIITKGGYGNVRLLWRQTQAGRGPAIVVAAETGGSGGGVDIYSVTFGQRPQLQQIESRDLASLSVRNGLPELEAGFSLSSFNGAPNAGTIVLPLPLRWNGGAFEADLPALVAGPALTIPRTAIRAELAGQQKLSRAGYTSSGTPLLAQALLAQTLSGHADRARALLETVWPRGPERRAEIDAIWGEFCAGVIGEPLWRDFGLARLPHANMVERAGHAAWAAIEMRK